MLDQGYRERVRYKQFVLPRVSEIRKLVAPEHWRYCPSELNLRTYHQVECCPPN